MAALFGIGAYLRGLERWPARGIAFLSGAVSAFGFAPIDAFPLLLLGYAALVLLIDGAAATPHPMRSAAWVGWAFAFGQFAVGWHWIVYAFLVDPGEHAWQIPFILLLPAFLALYVGLASAIVVLWWRPGPSRILIFAVAYAIAEWLRGHLLTGFPWNIAAYGWGASLAIMQSAALFGAYGLTFMTVLFGASLAELFGHRIDWRLPITMTLFFIVMFAGGSIRLSRMPTSNVPDVHLRIVQPNIAQADKYRPELIDRNWNELLALSARPSKQQPTTIIWPEAAPPFVLTRSAEALDEIALLTGRDRTLMTGALRALRTDDRVRYYNSFYVFGHGGQLLEAYDKFHLVPFGEYLPFEDMMKRLGLSKVVGIEGSFSTGDGPHTLNVPGAPKVGPLICYEILFPGEVVGKDRPDWFVNVTDDSWFGPWAGPNQHLLVARMRGIEEGLPVVRAANTGISAVIDPLGRVTAKLGLDRAGILDAALPDKIAPTFYARHGEFCLLFMLLVVLAGAVTLGRRP